MNIKLIFLLLSVILVRTLTAQIGNYTDKYITMPKPVMFAGKWGIVDSNNVYLTPGNFDSIKADRIDRYSEFRIFWTYSKGKVGLSILIAVDFDFRKGYTTIYIPPNYDSIKWVLTTIQCFQDDNLEVFSLYAQVLFPLSKIKPFYLFRLNRRFTNKKLEKMYMQYLKSPEGKKDGIYSNQYLIFYNGDYYRYYYPYTSNIAVVEKTVLPAYYKAYVDKGYIIKLE